MQQARIIAAVVGGAVVLGAAGALALRPWENPSEPEAPPNVLIVLWDTVRADRMSLYGHDKPTTPRLEAFAKQATVYDNATAPAMWTLPTHASMFTGLYATTHGAKASYRWLDQHHQTLAELLGQAGYDTFAFSSNLIASPMTNLTQGFDVVHTTFPRQGEQRGRYVKDARQATRAKLVAEDASTELSPAFQGNAADKWGKAVHKDAAPVLHKGLVEWLDERADPSRPWFAYLNMMEAHTPRLPSMSARERVMDAEAIELGLKTDLSLFAENEYMAGKRDYTEAELAAIRGVYDAAIVDLDDATGALFEDLASRGILDDTLVILVADHGEHLGEHRRFEHRWSVHEPLLHVPLVVRYPDRFEPGRVQHRVTTTDVFATVLDVAGVPAPQGHHSRSLAGRAAFDPHVFSQLLDPYASQLANLEEAYDDLDVTPLLRTYCVAYEGMDKLVWSSSGEHHLFDVGADPGELVDRFATEPERAKALADALSKWELALPDYDPSKRVPGDGGKGQSAREQQMLAVLGYVDEEEDRSQTRCGPDAAGAP